MAKANQEGDEAGARPGPRRGRWSRDEIERLREAYGLKDEEVIAREFGRSLSSVRKMAHSLFAGSPRSGVWSDEDVAKLRRYLGATEVPILARILRRTVGDVQRKISELAQVQRSGPWSPQEVARLKRLYGTRTDEDLSAILSREVDAIRSQARQHCLAKDKSFLRRQSGGARTTRMPRWSSAELALLKKLYPSTSNLDIAQQLGRSVKSVVSKAHHMKLKKDVERLRQMGRENVRLRYEGRE